MVETLTADERAELLAVVEEQVDELLAITAGADAATIELAVCASVLRTASAEFPAELADLVLGALEARGADAAACLEAVALLGPSALATRAREALERRAPARHGSVPDGLGALRPTEQLAFGAPGATVYLVRLERPGQTAWHGASVIVEERPEGNVLTSASMTGAEEGGELGDAVPTLARVGAGAPEPVDVEAVRSAVDHSARLSAARGIGVGAEAVACLPIIGRALGVPSDVTSGVVAAGGASPLALARDDEDAFLELRADLVEGFAEWLGEDDAEGLAAFVADVMLGFKWGYGDADLGRWTEQDLAELMLEHLPRKVDVDDEVAAALAPSITAFLGFLDARGWLSGEPLVDVCTACEDLVEPALEAARDPRRWGLAKRVTSQMTDDSVDVADQDAVDGWIGEFNARPDAERDAVLGPTSRASRGRSAPTQKKARRKAARVARRRNR